MRIQDLFFSFQGEGLLIGLPQIFLRFWGCNLACDYCDENSDQFQELSIEQVLNQIQELQIKKPHSLSLTGGEPLLQIDALKKLMPQIKLPLYLETNGTLPEYLKEIIDYLTYLSIDYKIGYEKEFIDFLFLANSYQDKTSFVKYVLYRDFHIQELQKLVKIISNINKNIPLVLQPLTPIKKGQLIPKSDDLFRAYNLAKNNLTEVRIIPQTHKVLNLYP